MTGGVESVTVEVVSVAGGIESMTVEVVSRTEEEASVAGGEARWGVVSVTVGLVSLTEVEASVTEVEASVTEVEASATEVEASATEVEASVTEVAVLVRVIFTGGFSTGGQVDCPPIVRFLPRCISWFYTLLLDVGTPVPVLAGSSRMHV